MKNKNVNNKRNGNGGKTQPTQRSALNALLDKPTRENSSGLAFTFAALFVFGLSLVASLILKWNGFDSETDTTKDWYLYLSYALSPIALFFAAFWYFYRTKKSVRETLKKQKCHPKYYLLAVALQVGLFSLSFLNTLFADFLKSVGYNVPQGNLPSLDGFGFVGVLFVIALLPAVFEEILFRGVVLDGAHVYGTAGAALLCGGLFALFHQNPVQTIYQFIWGAAFALMAIRAGSILPTMLAHFLNNAVIIILEKCKVQDIPLPVFISIIIVSGLCLIGVLGYLIFVDKNRLPAEENTNGDSIKTKRGVFLLGVIIGVFVCFVSWSSALYTGFLGS